MPTKEQMDAVLEQLERREIQYEGLNLAGLANANSDIDWTGFTESQRRGVELRIYDGMSPDMWMDGVQAGNEPAEMDTKALFAEWTADYAAANDRDNGKDEFNRILNEPSQREEPRHREHEERER